MITGSVYLCLLLYCVTKLVCCVCTHNNLYLSVEIFVCELHLTANFGSHMQFSRTLWIRTETGRVVAAYCWVCDIIQMMHGSEWTLKYDELEVENVARECSPSATFSTEGHHISVSHQRPCFICFVVWPTTSLKLYIVFWDGGKMRVSIVCHLKILTDLITVHG